jgi:hypothetical protein
MNFELNKNQIAAFYQRQSQSGEAIEQNLRVLTAFISSISAQDGVAPEDYFDSFTELEKVQLQDGIIYLI